jgi:hypothetical protein
MRIMPALQPTTRPDGGQFIRSSVSQSVPAAAAGASARLKGVRCSQYPRSRSCSIRLAFAIGLVVRALTITVVGFEAGAAVF